MSNCKELISPRIGVYYGVIIDQDHLDEKLQPIEFAEIVKNITGVCPFNEDAEWKLDYDHSRCYQTIVIYHKDYTKISECPALVSMYVLQWPKRFVVLMSADVGNLRSDRVPQTRNSLVRVYRVSNSTNHLCPRESLHSSSHHIPLNSAYVNADVRLSCPQHTPRTSHSHNLELNITT